MVYAIKAEITDPHATRFEFTAQKTMYGGKRIAIGCLIFIFASENKGGSGLIAKGIVVSATATPTMPNLARQTPRVSIEVARTALARRQLGRSQLKVFPTGTTGGPRRN